MEQALLYTRRFFPFVADAGPKALLTAAAVIAASVVLARLVPERRRKAALAALAFFYIAAFAGPNLAAAHLALAGLLWWALQDRKRLAPRLVPAALAAVACALAAKPEGLGRVLGLYLLALSGVKAVSLCVDAAAEEELRLEDVYLYLAGGVPANFMGPKYTFAAFNRSYQARPYEDIARKGALTIAGGALKFIAAAVLAANIPVSEAANASGPKLWLLLGALWAASLLRLTGIYDVLQGLNRLYAFDVPDQFDAPWLAQSPLDFWRRFGINNRDYLLKYVYYPLHRLGSGVYAALTAAFLASAAWNLLLALIVGSKRGPYNDPYSLVVLWAVFFVLFTLAAALEAALRAKPEGAVAARFGAGPARGARVLGMWLLLILLQAPMPYMLNLADRGPDAPSASLARRYADLYGRLFGRR